MRRLIRIWACRCRGPKRSSCGGRSDRSRNRRPAQLTVVGAHGRVILQMPEGRPWQLEVRAEGQSETREFPPGTRPRRRSMNSPPRLGGSPPTVDWNEASRAVELAESIDRSLVRGRAIDLHNENFTDIGTFKGTMTSLGCGLLLTGLGVMFCIGIVEAVARKVGLKQVADALRFWPYWLVGFLVAFLLLQLVLKVAAPADSRPAGPEDEAKRPGAGPPRSAASAPMGHGFADRYPFEVLPASRVAGADSRRSMDQRLAKLPLRSKVSFFPRLLSLHARHLESRQARRRLVGRHFGPDQAFGAAGEDRSCGNARSVGFRRADRLYRVGHAAGRARATDAEELSSDISPGSAAAPRTISSVR